MQNQSGDQSADGWDEQSLQWNKCFRFFHGIASRVQDNALDDFTAVIKEHVHQSAENADNRRENEVKSFLFENEFFAPLDGALPMASKEKTHALTGHSASAPRFHAGNLMQKSTFDEVGIWTARTCP